MSKRFSKSSVLSATDLFAPWVPVTAQTALKQSPLYLPFLKIYSKTRLQCVEVSVNTDNSHMHTVHVGTPSNLRVAYLGMMGTKFRACVYDSPDSSSRNTTHVGTSDKCMYLVNRLLTPATSPGATFDNALGRALNFHNQLASDMGNLVTNTLKDDAPVRYTPTSDINGESIGWLIKRYFNDVAEADIPSGVRTAIDKAYKSLRSTASNMTLNKTRLAEFFDREKWMFGYRHDVGYFVGAAHFKQTCENYNDWEFRFPVDVSVQNCTVTAPIQHYKTFQSIPDDMRRELLASVAMTKMYLEGGTEQVEYADPERLIPQKTGALLDANACVDRIFGGGGMWMLVDRI
jgi:hypothetical protein